MENEYNWNYSENFQQITKKHNKFVAKQENNLIEGKH